MLSQTRVWGSIIFIVAAAFFYFLFFHSYRNYEIALKAFEWRAGFYMLVMMSVIQAFGFFAATMQRKRELKEKKIDERDLWIERKSYQYAYWISLYLTQAVCVIVMFTLFIKGQWRYPDSVGSMDGSIIVDALFLCMLLAEAVRQVVLMIEYRRS